MSTHESPNAKRKWVYYIFAGLIALQAVPAAFLLFLMVPMTVSDESVPGFLGGILMFCGCLGAFVNLRPHRTRDIDKVNVILLLCGLIGVALVVAFDGFGRFTTLDPVSLAFYGVPTAHAATLTVLFLLRMRKNPPHYELRPWQITPNHD